MSVASKGQLDDVGTFTEADCSPNVKVPRDANLKDRQKKRNADGYKDQNRDANAAAATARGGHGGTESASMHASAHALCTYLVTSTTFNEFRGKRKLRLARE